MFVQTTSCDIQYPSVAEQRVFAANYIKAWKKVDAVDEVFLRQFLCSVNWYVCPCRNMRWESHAVDLSFALASHLMWALWGVRNACSPIPFGYIEYSLARLAEYEKQKVGS